MKSTRFAEIDRKQTPPENAVLFVGSSSIRMWENLRTSFPNLKVINRGFGGSRLEDVNHYFDQIVAPYKPKTIVLYAGENDVNDGIAPETVVGKLQRIFENGSREISENEDFLRFAKTFAVALENRR